MKLGPIRISMGNICNRAVRALTGRWSDIASGNLQLLGVREGLAKDRVVLVVLPIDQRKIIRGDRQRKLF